MCFIQGTGGGKGEGRSPGGNCHTTSQLKDCKEASGSEDDKSNEASLSAL